MTWSNPVSGSSTRPPRMTRSNGALHAQTGANAIRAATAAKAAETQFSLIELISGWLAVISPTENHAPYGEQLSKSPRRRGVQRGHSGLRRTSADSGSSD